MKNGSSVDELGGLKGMISNSRWLTSGFVERNKEICVDSAAETVAFGVIRVTLQL